MFEKLPARLDIPALAKRAVPLQGSVPIQHFKRLLGWLADGTGELQIQFTVTSSQGQYCLSGRWETTLKLECQRCLAEMPQALAREFELLVTDQETQLQLLDDGQDAVWVSNLRDTRASDLFEDSVILELPLIARHAQLSECYQRNPAVGDCFAQERAVPPQSAFAALAELRKP